MLFSWEKRRRVAMGSERLEYVDILKGIGILLVIFSHSGAEECLMNYMGDFFVPFFFVASGYTFRDNGQPFMHVIQKRVWKLLKPYFFFSVVLILLYHRFSLSDILGVLYSRYCLYPYHVEENLFLMGGGNPPLWFLTAMMSGFVPFLFLMRHPEKAQYILLAFILYTFGCQYLPILLPWSIDTACLTAAFLYAGVRLRRISNYFSWPFYVHILIVAAFFVTSLGNGSDNFSVREYGRSFLLYYFACVLGTMSLLWLSKHLETTFVSRFLVALGRHSLVIFCIQMFLLRIAHQVFHGMLHLPTVGFEFYMISFIKVLFVAMFGLYISKLMTRFMPWLFR